MKFTPEMTKFIKKNCTALIDRELALALNNEHGTSFDSKQIKNYRQRLGLKKQGGIGKKDCKLFTEKTICNGSPNDGTVLIKVSNGLNGWQRKQRYIWEQAHGKIPAGYDIIFLDSNKSNCELENLEMVSHHIAMKMADMGLFSDIPAVTRAGLAVALHNDAIHKKMRAAIGDKKYRSYRNVQRRIRRKQEQKREAAK